MKNHIWWFLLVMWVVILACGVVKAEDSLPILNSKSGLVPEQEAK